MSKKIVTNSLLGARKQTSIPTYSPMLATLVKTPPEGDQWMYEVKWDGYRALAYCNKEKVKLTSRNNKSFNAKFYPLVDELVSLDIQAVLDGEIAVLKEDGSTSFESLQNWRSEADGELFYYVFDLLWLNGYSLVNLPLKQRKVLLSQLLPNDDQIKVSKIYTTSAHDFLIAAKKLGLEGMIAKDSESPYLSGERSKSWLKVKVQNSHEVVIGGYTINENTPKSFSSLLVGIFEGNRFVYTGKIGTGFNNRMQSDLMAKFKPLVVKQCPFSTIPDINKPSRFRPNPPPAKAVWLSPKIVCEVAYVEMTSDGVMRHATFRGLREDKRAKEVKSEVPLEDIQVKKIKSSIKLEPVKKSDRKTLLNPSEESQVKIISGYELKFSNLSKVFWPEEGYTKRDLINYYYQVSEYILPYLKRRPQSLNRFPNGIDGKSFYQKDVTKTAPDWIEQFPYHTSDGKDKNYLIVKDEADLLWMANLGAIEMNPWNSTVEKPDYPDWCIIDIDPTEKNSFDQVIQTALVTKDVLDDLNITGYCKTSGATGLHIYIPMGAKYTYEQCQLFGRLIATQVHLALPKFTSIERYTEKRPSKIYVDFLQNRPKATLTAPYSVRPKPGAPVSMPLHWDEVKKGLNPKSFTLKNAIQRIKAEGDLFKPVLGKGISLNKILSK